MQVRSSLIKNTYSSSKNPFMNVGGRNNSGKPNTGLSVKNEMHEKLRALNDTNKNQAGAQYTQSTSNPILDSMKNYSESLRNQRLNSKTTADKMKKLKYKFKDISSKIVRSKTSTSAKQVVNLAKREVLRLKRDKMSGKYDEDEMDAAITHAKAMERVAKKKVKHLEEEEMAKASGGVCEDRLEEKEQLEDKEAIASPEELEEEIPEEAYDVSDVTSQDMEYDSRMLDMYSDLSESLDDMDAMFANMENLATEMLDDFAEEMQSMLEELGFGEETESVKAAQGDMDPADLKMMKIKHRNKEMKDIVKADAEYLKAVFDKLDREKSQATGSAGISAAPAMSVSAAPASMPVAEVVQAPSEPTINVVL